MHGLRWLLASAGLLMGVLVSPAQRALPGLALMAQSADPPAAALSAALRMLNGVPQADCLVNNPLRLDCVTSESSLAEVDRGIAVFGVSDAGQNGGFGAALGLTGDGSWRIWFTSQNPYQLTRLPGDMVVCAGGEGLNLRAGPGADSAQIGTIADGTTLTGEQFVLTDPVDSGHAGFGWFKISAPEAGWVYSKYVAAAALNDACGLRNAQAGPS